MCQLGFRYVGITLILGYLLQAGDSKFTKGVKDENRGPEQGTFLFDDDKYSKLIKPYRRIAGKTRNHGSLRWNNYMRDYADVDEDNGDSFKEMPLEEQGKGYKKMRGEELGAEEIGGEDTGINNLGNEKMGSDEKGSDNIGNESIRDDKIERSDYMERKGIGPEEVEMGDDGIENELAGPGGFITSDDGRGDDCMGNELVGSGGFITSGRMGDDDTNNENTAMGMINEGMESNKTSGNYMGNEGTRDEYIYDDYMEYEETGDDEMVREDIGPIGGVMGDVIGIGAEGPAGHRMEGMKDYGEETNIHTEGMHGSDSGSDTFVQGMSQRSEGQPYYGSGEQGMYGGKTPMSFEQLYVGYGGQGMYGGISPMSFGQLLGGQGIYRSGQGISRKKRGAILTTK